MKIVLHFTLLALFSAIVNAAITETNINDPKRYICSKTVTIAGSNTGGSSGSQLERLGDEADCMDGVVANRVCYRLPYRVGKKMTKDDAEKLCTFQGGSLAEITTKSLYTKLFNYVKRAWSIDIEISLRYHNAIQLLQYVPIHLGGKFEGAGAEAHIILKNGEKGYMKLENGRTITTAQGWDNIYWMVSVKPGAKAEETGMRNVISGARAIPLCQFELK